MASYFVEYWSRFSVEGQLCLDMPNDFYSTPHCLSRHRGTDGRSVVAREISTNIKGLEQDVKILCVDYDMWVFNSSQAKVLAAALLTNTDSST
jgi:hypothetical protein